MAPVKTKQKLEFFQHWLDRLASAMAFISATAIILLVAVTAVSVFWRYLLRDPIFGIEDISTVLLSIIVAGAIAYGGLKGAHVNVNLISGFAGRGFTRLTDAIVRMLGTGICAFAAYALVIKGSCGTACGNFTPNLAIPHQPFYYLLAAGLLVYAAILLNHLITGLVHFSAGQDPNSLAD